MKVSNLYDEKRVITAPLYVYISHIFTGIMLKFTVRLMIVLDIFGVRLKIKSRLRL